MNTEDGWPSKGPFRLHRVVLKRTVSHSFKAVQRERDWIRLQESLMHQLALVYVALIRSVDKYQVISR